MKYFSMPADFNYTTIDKYHELNCKYRDSKIIEVYGQITVAGGAFSAARNTDELNKVDINFLKNYVDYLKEHDMSFNYTLNGTCNGNLEFSEQGLKLMFSFLEKLHNAGVTAVTVAMPSLLEVIKISGYDFKIKASTLCGINTANQALDYKRKGISRMVVDEDITRNFPRLQEIAHAFGEGVEIIVNDMCFTGCPYKQFHFNCISHSGGDSKEIGKNYYLNRCYKQRLEELKGNIHLNWIRPEDLKFYEKVGIHYFKIQGRQFVQQGDIVKVVEAYIKEDFDGDLLGLLNIFAKYNSFNPKVDNKKLDGFLKRFYERPEACKNNCSECNYCEIWAKNAIDYDIENPITQRAKEYFLKTDTFLELLEKVKRDHYKSQVKDEFDF